MAELELVGIHADGEHLVLTDEEGQRHRLVIDDALRAAVRRDRPQLEQLRADALRPREIQALIRAGATAEDVAADSGVAVELVRRYEGPAMAEREHVAQRARALTIGHEHGAPTLGDLVVDRLAGRGVAHIAWDARRRGSEPWEVVARFTAGDRDREATWQVDLSARAVTALDDESRWLSETDLSSAGPRRHLASVRSARLYDVETDADIAPALAAVDAVIRDTRPRAEPPGAAADADPPAAEGSPSAPDAQPEGGDDGAGDTEALLDELAAARGVRQRVEVDDDELASDVLGDDRYEAEEPAVHDEPVAPVRPAEPSPPVPAVTRPEPHTPALWDEPPAAHPAASHPEEAADATVLEPRPRGRRSRRTSVPSWDEIVFGAKND